MKKFLLIFVCLLSFSLYADTGGIEMTIKQKNAIGKFDKILGVKVVGTFVHQLDNGRKKLSSELKTKIYDLFKAYFIQCLDDDLKHSCPERQAKYIIEIEIDRQGNELELELFLKDLNSVSPDLIEFLESDIINK